MPLYEYQCRSCRKTEDVRHGFKETFDGKCAHCGGEMARVFSPAGIVFKGSGFYLTDSRKAEAASPGESGGGSKPPASSEASSSTAAPASTATPASPAPAAAPATSKSESAA